MRGASTIMAGWVNAALDGLVREGVDRRALTHGLRGFEAGSAARDSRVDVASVRRLWRRAATLNPDPLLGLKIGAGLPFQASNVITILVAHSATVGASIEMLLRYQQLVSNSGGYRAVREGDTLRLTYVPTPAPVEIHRLQVESVLGTLAARRAVFGATGVRPQRMILMNGAPAPRERYEAFLGLPVTFEARAGVIFAAGDLSRPVPGADPRLLELNAAYAESLLHDQNRSETLCAQVQAVIHRTGFRTASAPAAAAELGLSVRSLQRRLNEAGVSFSLLRDETRMREAMILLTESRLSLAELALRLGYSEESAFSRAVKAWWGAGPRELRRGAESA
ncbi:MAG: AraC family transcriptional regulator ligand-binding domain-containing protein [Pseudomonadota bacterium]|uniref:AraC family transcriptional regulator n=1 Tax=unclassified Phenylobacterium TaxID=2640670 RepID=UPI0006FBE4E7|nr:MULTISPECIES: AraC family transcriptional regulator [unclassified Phenylobacterium]KRB42939.1 hypothetical protein ASE02_20620 [Phenylobacterium sp. Root700]MBT9470261.1 AraC family transcriptional regulator ligand-binding domain-containing protein [Phenylobacterium sp.]